MPKIQWQGDTCARLAAGVIRQGHVVLPAYWVAEGFPYPSTSETAGLPEMPEPLISEGWKSELETHPDRIYADTILRIIEAGAKIG